MWAFCSPIFTANLLLPHISITIETCTPHPHKTNIYYRCVLELSQNFLLCDVIIIYDVKIQQQLALFASKNVTFSGFQQMAIKRQVISTPGVKRRQIQAQKTSAIIFFFVSILPSTFPAAFCYCSLSTTTCRGDFFGGRQIHSFFKTFSLLSELFIQMERKFVNTIKRA